MQRQIRIQGQIDACPGCGKQPKHYEWLGKHFLECSPCGTRTAMFPTFQQAVESWEHRASGFSIDYVTVTAQATECVPDRIFANGFET